MRNFYSIFFATLLMAGSVFAQNIQLTPERIARIKAATVKIDVDNGSIDGTGFIIGGNRLVTCFHVVEKFYKDQTLPCKAIFQSGEEIELRASPLVNQGSNIDSMKTYDFFILEFKTKPKTSYVSLRLGCWSSATEGSLTYTCGYPFAIDQQILAVGILSTKFTRLVPLDDNHSELNKSYRIRKEAWLDMTINNGNSGGALIRVCL
jgi:hypothetical protein